MTMIVSSKCTHKDPMLQNYISTAFYFGFIQREYRYNEASDEGINFIPFRPAPGNKTEKSFVISASLTPVTGTFTFGGILLQSAQY